MLKDSQKVGKTEENLEKFEDKNSFIEGDLAYAKINIRRVIRENYLLQMEKVEKKFEKKQILEKNREKIFCFRVKLML